MRVSLKEVGDLLLRWRDSGQAVSVLFTGGSDDVPSWERTGKVVNVLLTKFEVSWSRRMSYRSRQRSVNVLLTKFEVSWVDGGSEWLSYANEVVRISEDGGSLYLASSSGDSAVVYEVAS